MIPEAGRITRPGNIWTLCGRQMASLIGVYCGGRLDLMSIWADTLSGHFYARRYYTRHGGSLIVSFLWTYNSHSATVYTSILNKDNLYSGADAFSHNFKVGFLQTQFWMSGHVCDTDRQIFYWQKESHYRLICHRNERDICTCIYKIVNLLKIIWQYTYYDMHN